MVHRGLRLCFIVMFMAALPLAAQESQSERIEKLEKQLDALTSQLQAVRQELQELKGGMADVPAEQDLTAVDVAVTEPQPPVNAQPAAPATPDTLADVATVSNASDPGAAKVFNPDISVVGTIVGKAGQQNPYEYGAADERAPIALNEAEVAFQAFIDPYAKGNVFLAVSPEGIEVEEGYAQFIALPFDLTAKVGRFKSLFGKANTWHTHIRPWVDQPLMIHNFFGDEQLADDGISVSRLLPLGSSVAEFTAEVSSGDVNGVFERRNHNDLFYNAHAKVFRDITENSNLEAGASYARGTIEAGNSQFGGVDLTYRWRPLGQERRSMIARVEALTNDRSDSEQNLWGGYASLDRQIARRWYAGVRLDRADRFLGDGLSDVDKGVSGTLTFWPSEFSQLRTQLRRTRYGSEKTVNEVLFQLQFSIGAHGAHSF